MSSNHTFVNLLGYFSQLLHLLNEYTDLQNLWMTTPDLWNSNDRRLLCYLKLKSYKSRDYLRSEIFRKFLISRISNSSKQISLNLYGCEEITDVSRLGNVHALILSDCQGIRDVSSLGL